MNVTPGSINIRTADLNDAQLLAKLGATTFAQAFAAANTPEDMVAYLAAVFSPARQSAELQTPGTLFLIASVEDESVGYAQIAKSDPPDDLVAARPVELVRFYVDAAWHGKGVSYALMQEVLAQVALRQHDTIWLGVWEKNQRAIRFYKKWAFEVMGAKDFQLGSDRQVDLVMSRSVAPVPADR